MTVAVFDRLNFLRQVKTTESPRQNEVLLSEEQVVELTGYTFYANNVPQYVWDEENLVREATLQERLGWTGQNFEYDATADGFLYPQYYTQFL